MAERRKARVRGLCERLGMQSQRVLLREHDTTMHCWVPKPSCSSPLLLLHGFGGDGMATWEAQLEALSDAGFAVYVPDLVFFGRSSSTRTSGLSVAFQTDCLVAMLRLLGVESRVHVVGTSYGGLVALHLASTYPDLVNKVVIASSGLCMDAADGAALRAKLKVDDMMDFLLPTTVEGIKAALSFLLLNPPRLPYSAYEDLLVTYLKNRYEKVELSIEAGIGTDKAFSRPTITQEVLLIWGENDNLFETNQGRKLQKHLGYRPELVILKNAGHNPHSETPRAFNNAVLAFLKDDLLHQSRL